jgi:hypothetical protein
MDNLRPGFGGLIIFLLIALGLFFLLRSIMLWYWKIDTIIINQEEQKKLMKEQKDLLEQMYLLQGGHKLKYTTDSQEEIERKAKLFDQSQNK